MENHFISNTKSSMTTDALFVFDQMKITFYDCPNKEYLYSDLTDNTLHKDIVLIKAICQNYRGYTKSKVEKSAQSCAKHQSGLV